MFAELSYVWHGRFPIKLAILPVATRMVPFITDDPAIGNSTAKGPIPGPSKVITEELASKEV
ncbi:unnamed protein product, partial [marine sediment metagenome]